MPKAKHSKTHEKSFAAHITVYMLTIVLCLCGMSFSAYAWFSASVFSGISNISAANYNLLVSVTDNNNNAVLLTDNTFDAAARTEYSVTLRYDSSCTADTGFCIINIDNNFDGTIDAAYHTSQITKDGGELKFKIHFDTPAKVSFVAHWGEAVNYNYNNEIKNDGVLTQSIII